VSTVDPSNVNVGWDLYTYANVGTPTQVGFAFSRGNGASQVISLGTDNLVAGQYYDVTVVYDAAVKTSYLYVNGTLQATQADTNALVASTSPLIMGMDPVASANYFSGDVDDVRIYDRAINAAELVEISLQ
jgi:hypothetical protein